MMKNEAKFKLDDRVVVHDNSEYFRATIISVKSTSAYEKDSNSNDDDSTHTNPLKSCAPYIASLILSKDITEEVSIKEEEPRQHWSYFVHFYGWNTRYRKWVAEDDVLEENSDSLQLLGVSYSGKGQIRVKACKKSNNSISPSTNADEPQAIEPDKTTTCDESCNKKERISPISPNYEKYRFSTLPQKLYSVLIKEKSYIMPKYKINNTFSSEQNRKRKHQEYVSHKLPSQMTISAMLQQFLDYVSNNKQLEYNTDDDSSFISLPLSSTSEELDWDSFVNNITSLFNSSLSKILLYPVEHDQYKNLDTSSNNNLSEIYGCEFLLRLFIQLDMIMKSLPSSKKTNEVIFRYQIFCLAQYLNKFSKKYFLDEYMVASVCNDAVN